MLTYRARIMKEQNDLRELKDPNMIIFINESDILIWYAYLFGPEGTPYSNGVFKVIKFIYFFFLNRSKLQFLLIIHFIHLCCIFRQEYFTQTFILIQEK